MSPLMLELGPVAVNSLDSHNKTCASSRSPTLGNCRKGVLKSGCPRKANCNKKDGIEFEHFVHSLNSYLGYT